ncbi:hypothetical protein [Corynebacterium matruchotii]|uniref:Uncharacterized protein n=1 Tax=Corynebacterium matruchotii ATCC 33806 TaxID=566549 RepID=C0E3T3_9CORY|nr:hypothetical protein [Corynebacterium matruchotii]EEG26826.1 hypothetical protein CORMATOL_01649 [Corynebacterium matruchotii ATCC 33806]
MIPMVVSRISGMASWQDVVANPSAVLSVMKCSAFADAAGFLHDLRLACNACLAMLLQKIHQLIESFLSDFWPGMVHDADISPCVTGVFIPALVVSAAYRSLFNFLTYDSGSKEKQG